MQARIQSLLDAAKVSDLLSAGVWLDQLKTDVATARAAGNFNAVMNGTRLLGQALGVLRDNVNLTVEQRSSDQDLVRTVAGDDPAMAKKIASVIGAPDGFESTRH